METREILSLTPEGNFGVVFTQRKLADGTWHNQSSRRATAVEVANGELAHKEPMPKTENRASFTGDKDAIKLEPGARRKIVSGSHNIHSRATPPSGSKRWMGCTASPAYCAANWHRIFPMKVGRLITLEPYLKTIWDEVGEDERRALEIAKDIKSGAKPIAELTSEEIGLVERYESSKYAREGTRAHDWAAKVLEGQVALLDVPDEIRDPVGEYVTHCLSLVPEGVSPMIEVKAPLFYNKKEKGTSDFCVVTDALIENEDYKHGAGVLVRAEENTQGAIYAMSLVRHLEGVYDFQPDTLVRIGIKQPRHHEGAHHNRWEVTLADLEKFCEKIEVKAHEAQAGLDDVLRVITREGDVSCSEILAVAPGTKFDPSEGDEGACRWCDAKAFCEVRNAAGIASIPHGDPNAMLAAMPDLSKEEKDLDANERLKYRFPDQVLDDEFLVGFYAAKKNVLAAMGDVEEYLESRAHAGDGAPGTKLVMGREGNRAWRNEEEAETFLKGQKLKLDERCDFKLKSPTKIEKLLKEKLEKTTRTRNRFEELVTRSAAKEVLALASDKRDAVKAAVELMPSEEEFAI